MSTHTPRKQKRNLEKEVKARARAFRKSAFKDFKEMSLKEQEAYMNKVTQPVKPDMVTNILAKLTSFLR